MARNTLAPGGYIGGEPPRRPYFNQLSGVWKLDDAMERQKAGIWANPLGIEDLFSTYLYTGNGSTQAITNGIDLAGEGGLVWIKERNAATQGHALFDTARGNNYALQSNTTAQQFFFSNSVSFQSAGFNLGSDPFGYVNTSSNTYASWTFRKAPKFFDVVTWTGDGNSARTISHSLGSTPGFIIVKRTDSTGNWVCWHRSISTGNLTANNVLILNSNGVQVNPSGTFETVSSTSFVTGINASGGTYVAYLFAHDAGGFGDSGDESVIKCGSYVGNLSADGPEVNLGWEPQFVMIKRASGGTAGWFMFDAMRGIATGGTDYYLYANTAAAEDNGDFLSVTATGFKLTLASAATNNTGDTYIYIAIRRGPMKAPTSGTEVFAMDTRGGTAPTPPAFNAPFPVDFGLYTGTDAGTNWSIGDRLRGPNWLFPNLGSAEVADSTLKFDYQDGWWDNSSVISTYPGWMFRRAPGFFDVVGYAGNNAARTIGHNLGVAPELLIIKARNSASGWITWSSSLALTENLNLISNAAKNTGNNFFNSTAPSASVITLSDSAAINASSVTYIAYLFATCPGVSKVGSYTGTGTTLDIDCGFTAGARFVLIKRTDSTGDWYVWDSARGIIAANDPYLLLNSTAAEVTNTDYIDPLSSGFQISSTAPAAINANGGSFIFFAVA